MTGTKESSLFTEIARAAFILFYSIRFPYSAIGLVMIRSPKPRETERMSRRIHPRGKNLLQDGRMEKRSRFPPPRISSQQGRTALGTQAWRLARQVRSRFFSIMITIGTGCDVCVCSDGFVLCTPRCLPSSLMGRVEDTSAVSYQRMYRNKEQEHVLLPSSASFLFAHLALSFFVK